MNLTKTKKIVAAGLSALMMMTSTTSVFAAETGNKSANLNYQVSSSYDWIIHSSIDFGADAGTNKTVDRTGNQVKVLKNVIPEGKYLNISVKGSGANDAFTVDNGGSEVLNYDVSDDNGAVGVNGNVLSVPAGTNTATQNMGFKLNTTKKSAEVAGQYNGRVVYNAEVGTKVTIDNGDILNIEGTQYVLLEKRENNQALVMTANSVSNKQFQEFSRSNVQNESTYEGSTIDNFLENEWYRYYLSTKMKMAIQTTNIKQASYKTYNDPDSKKISGCDKQVYNTITRHAFLPSVSELGKVVDLKNSDKVKTFLNSTSIWTRDSYQNLSDSVEYLNADSGSLDKRGARTGFKYGVRPVVTVDLSGLNYSVVGPLNTGNTINTSGFKRLDIEGTEYVVLGEQENDYALVMTVDSIGDRKFQSNERTDGQNMSTYEGSEIDNYLENEWYNDLSSTMKTAIQSTNIKQTPYRCGVNQFGHTQFYETKTGYNGQMYNTINRHVFLPSEKDIGKVVDFDNRDKVRTFFDDISIWTRDSCNSSSVEVKYFSASLGEFSSIEASCNWDVRPVFVIDLSQVTYSVIK